jgi:hypothetical protein
MADHQRYHWTAKASVPPIRRSAPANIRYKRMQHLPHCDHEKTSTDEPDLDNPVFEFELSARHGSQVLPSAVVIQSLTIGADPSFKARRILPATLLLAPDELLPAMQQNSQPSLQSRTTQQAAIVFAA